MGHCPDFYEYFVAADRCNCKPWELLDQSIYWLDKAIVVARAETDARRARREMGLD